MFTTTVEAEINCQIEKVFSYIRNFERMTEYNHSLKSSKWKSQDKLSCEIILDFSIVNIRSEYKLIQIEENYKIIAQFDSSSLSFEDIYEFEKRNNKTFLRITDHLNLKGLLRLSEGFLSGIFKKEMQGNLDRLIAILEKM